MSQTQAQQVTQHLEEVQTLRQRLRAPDWGADDWALLDGVLASYECMLQAFFEAKISLKRLLTLVFGTRRRRKALGTDISSGDAGTAAGERVADERGFGEVSADVDSPYALGAGSVPESGQTPRKGGHLPGYGRLGADAYTGAERVECRHEELAVGQRCPVCGQGRLYALPPGMEIRIDGNALLSAIRYALEKLRCSACGEIVRRDTHGANCPRRGPKFRGDDFEVNDLPDPERAKGPEHVGKAETVKRRVWWGSATPGRYGES